MNDFPASRRYLISSLRIFAVAFGLVITAQLQGIMESGGMLTADALKAVMYSAVMAGATAIVKFAHEAISAEAAKSKEEPRAPISEADEETED